MSEQFQCRIRSSSSRPTSLLGAAGRRTPDGSLGAEAYRRIRERIVSLELPPASLIDEQSLAAEIGLGLTPVRQALRRLAWENLVVIMPRRGTLVADVNPADLSALFEVRIELEGLAAELAAVARDAAPARGARRSHAAHPRRPRRRAARPPPPDRARPRDARAARAGRAQRGARAEPRHPLRPRAAPLEHRDRARRRAAERHRASTSQSHRPSPTTTEHRLAS